MPRPRSSLPSPIPGTADPSLVSELSLDAVRARLERNARVLGILGSGNFGPTSPPVAASTSPLGSPASGAKPPSAAPATAHSGVAVADPDPVRQKLLEAREMLLAREQELLALGVEGVHIGAGDAGDDGVEGNGGMPESSAAARRRSSAGSALSATGRAGGAINGGTRSGKARALEAIQANESRLAKNGLLLPLDETVALGQRDYYDAAAQRLSQLSLAQPARPTSGEARGGGKSRRRAAPDDEIARAQAEARMRAFMSYKAEGADDDDDGDGMDGIYEDDRNGHDNNMGFGDQGGNGNANGVVSATWEGEYDGDGDRLDFSGEAGGGGGGGEWRESGTGEEVDALGEDDERWAEGSDEYRDRVL